MYNSLWTFGVEFLVEIGKHHSYADVGTWNSKDASYKQLRESDLV